MKSAQQICARTKLIMIAVNNSISFKQQFDTELWNLLYVLQYEYAQVTVDLLYENITFVHCSVAVCIHVSPFFVS